MLKTTSKSVLPNVEMGFKDVAEHGLTNDSGGAKKENQTTSILSTKNEYFWIKSLPAFIIILGSIFVQKLPRLLGRWNWAALTAPQTMNRPSTPDSDDGDHNADNAPTNGPIRVVDEHWARPVPGTPDLIRPATPPDRMQLSSPDQTPPAEAPEAPRRRGGNSLMTLRDLERVNYKPFFRRQSRRYVQRRVQRASVLTTVDIHN